VLQSLPREAPLSTLQHDPTMSVECGKGVGMAVCLSLDVLVTSSLDNTLAVYALPGSRLSASAATLGMVADPRGRAAGAGEGSIDTAGPADFLVLLHHIGGEDPFRFKFESPDRRYSGYLAFSVPSDLSRPLVVLSDAGHDAVHLLDVLDKRHLGYVATPKSISGPRGVATTRGMVAVSSWMSDDSGEHVVHIFVGGGSCWTRARVLGSGCGAYDSQMDRPYGLRFSSNGTHIAVADCGNGRVGLFRVHDSSFVGYIARKLAGPRDVEECKDGWLITCLDSNSVEHVPSGHGSRSVLGRGGGPGQELRSPSCVTIVRGLGLVVKELFGLRLFR